MEALAEQLKEIREEGSLNIGYNNAIFKDENFDLQYMINEVLPDVINRGVLTEKDFQRYTQHILLDGYMNDLEVEEFQYIAKYFFNYKHHNNK